MHTKESIRTLLETNDKAVQRAVFVLWQYQTTAEQLMQSTSESNGAEGANK